MRDPIVEEVHRWRAELLKEAGGTLDKLMDYLKECEKEHPERLVTKEDIERMEAEKELSHA